ncbi:MAG: N-formylglutamate amidohydrolase [Candidatus Lokiarchaeota archaeon]|nr:N-formylglutamate amidohydrolase [Candidatus Lokiarchaeota archaeon]
MTGLSEFVEFKKGNIPLIVSVPHGGILECNSLPERITGVLGIDKGTIEFSKNFIDQISQKFKDGILEYKFPYYIFSLVQRSKIDLNRVEKEAYNQKSLLAREIYNYYHSKIKEWILNNLKRHNRSFLIDIHGFEKDNRPPGFRDVDVILGTNNLESLFPEPIPIRNWGKNIRGKIIQKFLEVDIPIAPGHPRRREYVLTGGYITRTYGASHIPKSQTIQIEISDRIRIDDKELREIVIKILVDVLFEDLKHF